MHNANSQLINVKISIEECV